jgi:hypothetical protein
MAAIDRTQGQIGEPATDGVLVTPSDSTELTFITRALYIGGAGDLNVIMKSGNTIKYSAVPAGTVLPIRVKQVLSTGTGASLIVAMD